MLHLFSVANPTEVRSVIQSIRVFLKSPEKFHANCWHPNVVHGLLAWARLTARLTRIQSDIHGWLLVCLDSQLSSSYEIPLEVSVSIIEFWYIVFQLMVT